MGIIFPDLVCVIQCQGGAEMGILCSTDELSGRSNHNSSLTVVQPHKSREEWPCGNGRVHWQPPTHQGGEPDPGSLSVREQQ